MINGVVVEENDLGSMRRVTADTLPILSGISIKFSSFTGSAGEMLHVDSGSLHHIENIGDEPEFPFTKTDPLLVTRDDPPDAHAKGE
ncbi:MAG: thermophilic glucose-6-phosphate isomerase-like enzyme [Mycobacterium sp.]|nr:thermophilic glucose-6-phosphate isomerase-like enzyme [Mycobacterium sp.]